MCNRCTSTSSAAREVILLSALLAVAGAVSPALSTEPHPLGLSAAHLAADGGAVPDLLLAQADTPSGPVATRQEIEASDADEPTAIPLSIGLTYGLYSDYVFRGVNFSEYPGEGREKPNHQLTTSIEWDTGKYGTFGFVAWFEWYAAQKSLDPAYGGQNLQEVDYVISWSYPIDAIATDLTLGYTFYVFPNLGYTLRQDSDSANNNDDRTHEYWFSLEHNDAWMWRWLLPENEDGVLNPSFLFAHDVGEILGVWMEFGLSHDFAIPGVDNLTITPGWKLLVDCNYWSEGIKLAGDQWSLITAYDLTPLLRLPAWAGKIGITGELYFFNAFGNMEDTGVLSDEFWGGMTVNWSWGG